MFRSSRLVAFVFMATISFVVARPVAGNNETDDECTATGSCVSPCLCAARDYAICLGFYGWECRCLAETD
jgi:hypothetical protein